MKLNANLQFLLDLPPRLARARRSALGVNRSLHELGASGLLIRTLGLLRFAQTLRQRGRLSAMEFRHDAPRRVNHAPTCGPVCAGGRGTIRCVGGFDTLNRFSAPS